MLSETAHWEGSIEELAAEVDRQLAPLDPEGRLAGVNVRLIRHYLSIGAISRPGRLGRETRFQWRQVLECMAIRALLADGWPLAKIADLIQRTDAAGLIALVPGPRPSAEASPSAEAPPQAAGDARQQAQALVARFQQQGVRSPRPRSPAAALDSAATSSQERARFQWNLTRLGNPAGQVQRGLWVKLGLTAGCEVLVDPQWLELLDEERIEQATDAFKQALRQEFFRGHKKWKA